MKINEITESRPGYASDPKLTIIANLGRRLMDISAKMPMGKKVSDEEVAKSNRMSSFGDALTRFGTNFGPKSLPELIKASRVTPEEAKEFLALAQNAPDPELKGNDVEPEDDEDDFDEPNDIEIARQADARASKRK